MLCFLTVIISALLFDLAAAQQYQTVVNPGVTYEFYPANSNGYYYAGQSYSWVFTSAPGYKIALECTVFNVPCANDVVYVNKYGSTGATETPYCGTGTLAVDSITNAMIVRLYTNSNRGQLYCRVQAKADPCQCGRRKTARIVGGVNANVNEFPYQVMYTDTYNNLICSGSLISQYFSLTAAHCIKNRSPASTRMIVGEHDRSATNDSPFTGTYEIAAFTPHTGYNSANSDNDIGLVRSKLPVTFNEGVGVVCLPYTMTGSSFENNLVTATGWGTTEFGGSAAGTTVLQKVNLNVIPNAQCQNSYPNGNNYNFICTYMNGKDTCQLDSGTNLYLTTSRVYSVGVTSGGIGCAGSAPTLNMRVTQYLNWIGQNAVGAQFCSI